MFADKFKNPLLKVSKDTWRIIFWIFLLLMAVLGVWVMLFSTRYGCGLRNDSFAYIAGARNLAAGNGYGRPGGSGDVVPLTHFPPMFSIVMVIPQLLGIDAVVSARWINAILFGAIVVLAGLIIRKMTRSTGFALFGAALVLCSSTLIDVYSWTMSEPLYLFLAFLSFYLLAEYFDQGKWWLLAACGLIVGMAYLTRYVGAALAATAGLAILFNHSTWRRKFRDLGLFVVFALPLIVWWMVRNYLLTGSAANRDVIWHPVTIENIQGAINNIIFWFIPGRLVNGRETLAAIGLGVIVVAAGIFGTINLWKALSEKKHFSPGLPFILAAHMLIYVVLLFFSISFIEYSTDLDNRILTPLYLCSLILAVYFLYLLWIRNQRLIKVGIVIFCILYAGFFANRGWDFASKLSVDGRGFNSENWREAQIVKAIRKLPDVPIYTDSPTAVYLLTGRVAFTAPFKIDPSSGQARDDYSSWLEDMRRHMKKDGAVLVIFNVDGILSGSSDEVWMGELTKGLTIAQNYQDGRVYTYQP
jgi:4-amino-4-deoxy-L-arabinose transferase-like glycosyltransferase